MKRKFKIVFSVLITGFFMLLALGSDDDSSESSSTPSETSGTHTCSYCGKEYSGSGYYHFGNDCVKETNPRPSNMCSRKCCMDAWNAGLR